MAYSFAEISATEIALRDADKPQLIAQAIPTTPAFVGWNTAGTVGGGDSSDSGYPASRSIDGFAHLYTRPDTAQVDWYLVFDFGTGVEFDWIGLIGGSETMRSVFDSWDLQIADDGAFTVNLITIPIGVSTSQAVRITQAVPRHAAAAGTDANRYSNVQYARLRFRANLGTNQPEIGEVVLGRRRQLKHKPRTPYDDNTLTGEHSDTVTAAGVRHRYTYNDGRRRLSAAINPSEEPYLSDVPAWYRTGQRFGRSPFAWAENPFSDPGGVSGGGWHFMQLEIPDLVYPCQDFVERTFDIIADEQGPERFYLERE